VRSPVRPEPAWDAGDWETIDLLDVRRRQPVVEGRRQARPEVAPGSRLALLAREFGTAVVAGIIGGVTAVLALPFIMGQVIR
jgi:hypothetical protein